MRPFPFVGRVRELDRLADELDSSAHQGSRIVIVVGEPGVGKTRLLSEFEAVARRRARCLIGRGSPMGTTIRFSILAEALETQLRGLMPQQIIRVCGRHLHELAEVLPSVSAALGRPSTDSGSRLGTFEGLLELLGALANDRPVLLCLNDLHQADPDTWAWINYLGRNPVRAPILVVATTRSEPMGAFPVFRELIGTLLQDGLADRMELSALSKDEVALLARRTLGPEEVERELTDWLFDQTRGNPLLAVSLLEELAADPSRRVVPASVRERVRSMGAGLPEDEREVLNLAAVLGRSFGLRTVAMLLPDGAEALDRLIEKGLLVWVADGSPVRYEFIHPLVQEAVYENIGPTRRRKLHMRIAVVLEADQLSARAYHAARGALPGNAEAIHLIWEAAREAEKHQSHREALTHLLAAKDLLSADAVDDRKRLLDEIAWQAGEALDHATLARALRELEALAGDDRALATVKMRLSSPLSCEGDLVGALREAETAVRLFRESGSDDRLPLALNELAWVRGFTGDLRAQLAGTGEVLGLGEVGTGPVGRMRALGPHGHVLSLLGRFAEARACLEESLRMAHDTKDEHQIAWQGGTLGAAWIFEGDFMKAGAVLDELSSGRQLPSDLFYGYRAWSNWFLGRWRTAVADCATVQALNPGAPAASTAWAVSFAGLLRAAMGSPADAGPYLAQADRIFRGGDLYWCSGVNDWAAGCTLWFCNDPEGGLERLDRAARRLEAIGALPLATQVSLDLVDVLVTLGEMTEADLVAGRIESLSGNLGTPFASAQASYARGVVLARRRAAAAEPLLRAAAAGADQAGAAWIRARALEHLATVLEGSERISVLSEATRLYSMFPAPAHEGRALAALRAMGPAGRRAARAVGELTIRETEVVRLAKRGLNTREIAGNLHVSARTVETHLAHIYRKLGVSGRKELLVVGPGQPGEPGLVRSPPASPPG